MQDAIAHADLVLIPLRPSAVDLIASEDAVLAAQRAGIAYLCVLNDAEPAWKTTGAAKNYLAEAEVRAAKTIIGHRKAYLAAMTSGRTGPEVEDRKAKCETEVNALWGEIKRALADSAAGKEKSSGERVL
jgi:chromosome partitioning protein